MQAILCDMAHWLQFKRCGFISLNRRFIVQKKKNTVVVGNTFYDKWRKKRAAITKLFIDKNVLKFRINMALPFVAWLEIRRIMSIYVKCLATDK